MQVAVTIGNFDGVHVGHRRLVAAAREAVGVSGVVRVLAFDPHPLGVLRPGRAPGRLTSLAGRTELLRQAGADEVETLRPTPKLLRLDPETFVAGLVRRHRPAFIIEGPDFRFGRDRGGTVETLRAFETTAGFETIVIDPVSAALVNQHVVPVSSTMIRWLLGHGRIADAARLLGRPYELRARVVRGERRGRTLGVPTANLDPADFLLPADGVYAGRAARVGETDGSAPRWYTAAISIGTKPTFGDQPRLGEVHLLDYYGPFDDYGWEIRVEFTAWLREQLCYSDVAFLVEQIGRDMDRAEAVVSRSIA